MLKGVRIEVTYDKEGGRIWSRESGESDCGWRYQTEGYDGCV